MILGVLSFVNIAIQGTFTPGTAFPKSATRVGLLVGLPAKINPKLVRPISIR
jgi:hypothetical protein